MEKMKEIKCALVNCVKEELDKGIENVDTHELYEAIDMIKDMSDAIYHCQIVKAMEEDKTYTMTAEQFRDMDIAKGKMYYTEPKSRYDVAKKYYTESKMMKPDDRQTNIEKLDAWMQEVKSDVMNLATQMSNEEKTMAKRRIQELASMII